MTEVLGHFGFPPDAVAKSAVALAVVLWVSRRRATRAWRNITAVRSVWWIRSLALLAALASIGYFYFYLRGGPRIIDATYYWLQAKTFAKGHVTLPLLYPSAALRGRFLYFNSVSSRLSVLFPPGYAAILALGMVLKVPAFVGPCIAACLVFVTAALARRIFNDYRVTLVAALLSTLCVALRYHTADTLSHGLASLLFALSVWGALGTSRRDLVVSGLCAGWLLATRPISALALFVVVALVIRIRPRKRWGIFAAALLPGVAAWIFYQQVTTGSWLNSTQLAYYAVSDGPPGCFRYGFGHGIGCHFEHGRYVASRLPNGYTFLPALIVSAVRLRWHLLDVLNFEPLFVVVILAAKGVGRNRAAQPLIWAPVLLFLAYVPFYFDGNFPGGGARLLADGLPFEHVLVSSWLVQRSRLIPVLALSLLGFGLHGAFEHQQLQHREGGHPMFDPRAVSAAGISRGLILVDTDHGFAIGHEPGEHDALHGTVIARIHNDAHDWVLWHNLGFPPLYRYLYGVQQNEARPQLAALNLTQPSKFRFEAEAEWPVLELHDGWAIPGYPPTACVSNHRALIVHPSGRRPSITIALPVPQTGHYRVGVGWVMYDNTSTTLTAALGRNTWQMMATGSRFQCGAYFGPSIELVAGEQPLQLQLGLSTLGIDWVELIPAP